MATFDVYVFANSDDEICELRNSTFSSATNAPGSVGNPIACSQGDSIRFNYSFSGGASGGTITPDYNGSGSNYWTNTNATTILASSNNPVTYQLKSNAVTGTGARARVSGGGENTLVYLNISAPVINPPVISGTTFLYFNNQTGAVFISGSTYFVQTRINLSSNGDGGTLEYGRNTSSDNVAGASWQTSNTFNHLLGGVRYFYASQDRATAGTFDSTGGVLYDYIAPANVSVFSTTVDFGATSKVVSIGGTSEDFGGQLNRAAEAYSISLTDFGNGEISASTVSADRIGVVNNRSNEPDVDFTIPNGSLPANTAGAIETYYVYAYRRADWSGKEVYLKRDSFTLTRNAQPIVAPVIATILTVSDQGTSVTQRVVVSSTGSGGTLQYAQSTTNSVPATGWQSSNEFSQSRNTTRYYWASQATNTAGAFDGSAAIFVDYAQPDVNINFSNNPSGNIASDYAGNVITTVTGGTAGVAYRVLRSTGGNLGCGNTGELTGTTGTITIGDAANELPPQGAAGTFDYAIQARRGTSTGGDGVTWVNTNPLRTFSITRTADVTPNPYTIPDVPSAALNTEQNVFVQITGISQAVTASRTSGTATFAISSSTTTPSAGNFSGTAKSISNNQYLHVKQTSSATSGTTLNTDFSVGGVTDTFSNTTVSATAPVASSVTFNNPANPNTTATVNLSSTGANGVLQYACALNNTAPTNWQSSNQFTISRGSSGTVYARARRDTTVSNTVNAARPGFLDPDTDLADINNQNFVNGTASSFIVSISGGNSNTVYEVRETSNSGTVLASRTGDGNITVNDIPANNSIKTYYVTAYRTTTSGGGGSGVVSAVQTFTVTVGTVTSAGGAGTSTGTSNYGVSVFGPDGTTVVWGTNNRQTNLEVNDTTTYTDTGTTSKTFTVANANDATKVIVAVGVPNPTTGPITQIAASGVTVTKTSTGFTVSVSFSSQVTSLTVRALAARIA